MHVLGKPVANEFCDRHPECRSQVFELIRDIEASTLRTPQDLIARYPSARAIPGKVIFKVRGNRYRLVAKIAYNHQLMEIAFVGTHSEYDELDLNR